MSNTRDDVQSVFRKVFDEDDLILNDAMTADDIEGWDSIRTLDLMIALEKQFKIQFAAAEIANLRAEGSNIGTLLAMIERKLRR